MSESDHSESTVEAARVGYQAAIQLAVNEATLNWAKFGLMVALNGFILSTTLSLLEKGITFRLGCVRLSLLGIALCVLWLFISERGLGYELYFLRSAREIEQRHLSPTVTTVARGASFAAGQRVASLDEGRVPGVQLNWFARGANARLMSRVLVGVFAVAQVAALVYSLTTPLAPIGPIASLR